MSRSRKLGIYVPPISSLGPTEDDMKSAADLLAENVLDAYADGCPVPTKADLVTNARDLLGCNVSTARNVLLLMEREHGDVVAEAGYRLSR